MNCYHDYKIHLRRKPAGYPASHPGFAACVGGGLMRLRTSNALTDDVLEVTCRRCARMCAPQQIEALNRATGITP
jgi:NAD(P)H-nitrite reductase large subunit